MKKILFVSFIFLMTFIVTGCGTSSKTLKCTGKNPGTNMNAYVDAEYVFKDDKLVKMNADVTFKDITLPNLSQVWDELKKQFDEQNPTINEEGYKRTSSYNDKDYEYVVKMEVDFDKISKETKDKYLEQDYSGKSYDEVKELLSKEEYLTCK